MAQEFNKMIIHIPLSSIQRGWFTKKRNDHHFGAFVINYSSHDLCRNFIRVRDNEVSLFEGYVVEEQRSGEQSSDEKRIVFVVSPTYLLDTPEKKKFHFYQTFNLKEMIENIVNEYKEECELLDLPETVEEYVQNKETDWSFITRIMKEKGMSVLSKAPNASSKFFKLCIETPKEEKEQITYYIQDGQVRMANGVIEVSEHTQTQPKGRSFKKSKMMEPMPLLQNVNEYFQCVKYSRYNMSDNKYYETLITFKSEDVRRILGLDRKSEAAESCNAASYRFVGIITEKEKDRYRVCFPGLERIVYSIYPKPPQKRRDHMSWIIADQFEAGGRQADYKKWDIVYIEMKGMKLESAVINGVLKREAEEAAVLYSMFPAEQEWKSMDQSEKKEAIKGFYDFTQDPTLPKVDLRFEKLESLGQERGGVNSTRTDKNGNYIYDEKSYIAVNDDEDNMNSYDKKSGCPYAYTVIYHERRHLEQTVEVKNKSEMEKVYGKEPETEAEYLNHNAEKDANQGAAAKIKEKKAQRDKEMEIFNITKDENMLGSQKEE